ncbi:MAG: pantoate--beta-alanine ligase [Verrucomicrobia bacterium]|nr:pantoate--beta-alanine ligase [Verrucomicrobiota bacterium]
MKTIQSIATMQRAALGWRRRGIKIGFVPTMGSLHAGHMSLVTEARRRVGPRGKVFVSIYVNPTQFGPKEDFSKYPRDLARDAKLCRAAGVDALFVPTDAEMYPRPEGAAHSTYVVEENLSATMEGAARPGHFRGVTTIVAKLFNLVLPDVAVFGAKDFQQAAVIRRMVRDLNIPVKIIVAPTKRELDGLAMSSRNKYLSPDERRQALALWQAIQAARKRVRAARRGIPAATLKKQLRAFIHRQSAVRVDYIEFFNPETLLAEKTVRRGTQMALAVFIGKTRLIDNARL